MHTYDIRLIAMDMDGTLLDQSQQIAPQECDALRAAQKRGIALAICSGRMPGDIARFLTDAGFPDCAILSLNGAYCLARPYEDLFVDHTLDDDTLMRVAKLLHEAHATFGCFSENRLVIVDGCVKPDGDFWGTHKTGLYAPEYLHGFGKIDAVRPHGVNKLLVLASTQEMISQLTEELAQVDALDVTSSWALNLELMPKGTSKGTGVRALAQRLGLSADQVMALGDYDNDIPMLAFAGAGVAMGNAGDRVKQAAKHTTLTNAEHGVAEAIRRWALA